VRGVGQLGAWNSIGRLERRIEKDVVKQWESCKSEQLTVSEAIEVETILDHFHQYGFVVPCKKRYYKRKVLSISIMQ
jgi:hypothetical protein